MKYLLVFLMVAPLFATELTLEEERLQTDLAQGKMIPMVEKGEVKTYLMDPVTENENQKVSKFIETDEE